MSESSRIAMAIVAAAAIVGLALYARPQIDRYEFKVANHQVQRFDTVTGEMLFCRAGRCHRYDRNGVITRLGQNLIAVPPPDVGDSARPAVNGVAANGMLNALFANEQ